MNPVVSGDEIKAIKPSLNTTRTLDDNQLTMEALNDLGLINNGPTVEATEFTSRQKPESMPVYSKSHN